MYKRVTMMIILALVFTFVVYFNFDGEWMYKKVDRGEKKSQNLDNAIMSNEAKIEGADKKQEDQNSILENKISRDYWPTISWKVAEPKEHNMDIERLEEAYENILHDNEYFRSFLVIRHGYIVFEKYADQSYKEQIYNIKSDTKSIISILIGIAIKEKNIENIEQGLEEFYPEYFFNTTDPMKRDIKLHHLLNMTAGFKWQQNNQVWSQWWNANDRFKFTINLPMDTKPGERFNYSSAVSHLLSGIITKTSGISTKDFAHKYLFKTLGINRFKWKTDEKGYYQGNSELFLTPRDMAKIGYLYLNKGIWDNTQVVSKKWVEMSTNIQAPNMGYGYQWWIKEINGLKSYYAEGYGGQYIFVIPDLDLIVVITSNLNSEKHWTELYSNILKDYVVKSVINN